MFEIVQQAFCVTVKLVFPLTQQYITVHVRVSNYNEISQLSTDIINLPSGINNVFWRGKLGFRWAKKWDVIQFHKLFRVFRVTLNQQAIQLPFPLFNKTNKTFKMLFIWHIRCCNTSQSHKSALEHESLSSTVLGSQTIFYNVKMVSNMTLCSWNKCMSLQDRQNYFERMKMTPMSFWNPFH